jgi:hypothetical protein
VWFHSLVVLVALERSPAELPLELLAQVSMALELLIRRTLTGLPLLLEM